MRNFRLALVVIWSVMVFISCGGNSETGEEQSAVEGNQNPDKLMIAAAASTQFAVKEIAQVFSAKNGIEVVVITGSSGSLTSQIINGAPYDIFFSANMKYPQNLETEGKTQGSPSVFGYGVPTLWSMNASLEFDSAGTFIDQPGIDKFAIADPLNAPYGEMAVDFLKSVKKYDQVKHKLVYGESISQVNEYIMNEVAQVGVSALSIILSPKVKNKGSYLPLSRKYWVPQGLVEINNNPSSEIRTSLMNFIASDEGVAILKKYGYEK